MNEPEPAADDACALWPGDSVVNKATGQTATVTRAAQACADGATVLVDGPDGPQAWPHSAVIWSPDFDPSAGPQAETEPEAG
jgi:hypothetical protein